MKFLEKDLETILYEAIKTNKLDQLEKKGIIIDKPYIIKRQLNLGNYGVADIVTLKRQLKKHNKKTFHNYTINVYELKKDVINLATLLQSARYAKGIKLAIRSAYNFDVDIKLVLIGRTVDTDSDWVFLFDVLDMKNVHTYIYDYDIDGISFEKIDLSEYVIVNKGI